MSSVLSILIPVGVVVILFAVIMAACYIKAAPTEAVVVTGAGLKVPKVVSGRGVMVIPFLQRHDKISMRVMKLDVKTPKTGVKTNEGVPLWIDSVVTIQVYSEASTVPDIEWQNAGCKDRTSYIKMRQQAAISNFLGSKEKDFDAKVNDILQGNLREIVAEMTVMDVLTRRKEFASRVIENAKPDLAKLGLEVVTFNIQDIQDAEDGCGGKHGVVEAIGVQREMEVKREASIASANAERDMQIAKANAKREAEEKQKEADRLIAEANNKLELRKAELRAAEDRARADAEAAGRIQQQIQEKTRKEAEADVEIAAQEKAIIRSEKEAEVKQKKLDAEIRKKADADKYEAQQRADAQRYAAEQKAAAEKRTRELDAEAELFEEQKRAEAKKVAADAALVEAQKEAEGIRAKGLAEAEAIRAKALAEAEGIEKKAEAQAKMGEASKLEMLYNVLPQVAEALAGVLDGADNVTVYGADGASQVMGSMTQGLNQVIRSISDATGGTISLSRLDKSKDAKAEPAIAPEEVPMEESFCEVPAEECAPVIEDTEE